MDSIESEKTPVLKFEPPALVYLANSKNEVFPEPLLRWDQLSSGCRVAIKSPWPKYEYLCGQVQGRPGTLVFVVGGSFGALEHVKETGWVCTGLVPQQDIMSELGQQKAAEAREAGMSFTDKLLKRAAKGKRASKGKKSGSPK